MNVLVVALTLGAAAFHQESLPGVRVTGLDPLSGHTYVNFRQVDVNDDRAVDLVLPDRVLLRRPQAAPPAFDLVPADIPGPGVADIFRGMLFVRTADGITEYRWGEDAWTITASQPIVWPEGDPVREHEANRESLRVADFGAFLYDGNTDAVPEIAIVTFRAVHIYSRVNGAFEEIASFEAPVASHLMVASATGRWPGDSRQFTPPALGYSFDVILGEGRPRVVAQEPLGPEGVRFFTTTYEDVESVTLSPVATVATESVPAYLRPCNLDGKEPIDLAGTTAYRVSNTLLPTTVTVTSASIDGGKTLQHFRTRGFRPKCSFIDVDGDGRRDLVTEETDLFAGGPKRVMAQLLTAREIPHSVAIHRLADGRYTHDPVLEARVAIRLNEPPIQFSSMLAKYRAGDVVDITGDFNGDSQRDLLVRTATDEVRVYLNHRSHFSATPDAIVPALPQHDAHAADIDGDGTSEILLQYPQGNQGSDSETIATWLDWD